MQGDLKRFKRRTWHIFGDLEVEGGKRSGKAGGFEERLQTNSQRGKGKLSCVTTSNWILLIT